MPCNLSEYNGIKLELKSKRNYGIYLTKCILNKIFLNDQWVIEERGEVFKNS
jgi:hypothetical protein